MLNRVTFVFFFFFNRDLLVHQGYQDLRYFLSFIDGGGRLFFCCLVGWFALVLLICEF